MAIHPTAVINPGAKIAPEVEIGPYVVIEDNVTIGPGVKIWANAYISEGTEIGESSEVHMGAVIGHFPQDLSFRKKRSYLKIGKRNIIREYATIHRGTEEESSTIIGDDNFIMGFVHIAHNCKIGNNVILANAATLGGHVEVEDRAFVSVYCAIHQFVRIGAVSMISARTRLGKDLPPYMLLSPARGEASIFGLNALGLRRAGFSLEVRSNIKKAYKVIYHSGLKLPEATLRLEESNPGPEVQHLIDFMKKKTKRGLSPHIRKTLAAPVEFAE
ncbi:MAG: acyl-ACP--UDP-N-acetylglucosamine O-acyltransferase [Candidatus Omnitrophica bacterium]|nr:acyl-ACP--UDP-N-acetylglucosamine O-acyltransferase [Candidatus Omnitrophota bacterium]MBU4488734.1 acyl-ACP--UDP-N-acetylglucosamine O-acyltransferase [Candidatus Omnitrophota bacterium]MCG2705831.1 acyl-ACP--UDP-N-acetylglucosamine O-acyltransferase [Candidatus Omnitrophota bacterium]